MSLKSSIQKKSIKRKQRGGAKGGSFVLGYNNSSKEYSYVVNPDEGIEDTKAAAVVAAAANSIEQDTAAAVVVASADFIKEEAIKKIIGEVAASGDGHADVADADANTEVADANNEVADVNAADATAVNSKEFNRRYYNKQFREFQNVKGFKETDTFTAGKLNKDCEGKQNLSYGCYYKNRVFSIIYNNETKKYGILKDNSLQRGFNLLKTAASSISKSELVYFDKLEIEIVSKKECKMIFFLNGVKQDLDIKIKKDTLQGIIKNIPYDSVEGTIIELNMNNLNQFTRYVDRELKEFAPSIARYITFLFKQEEPGGGRKSSVGSRKARTKVFKGSKKVNRA